MVWSGFKLFKLDKELVNVEELRFVKSLNKLFLEYFVCLSKANLKLGVLCMENRLEFELEVLEVGLHSLHYHRFEVVHVLVYQGLFHLHFECELILELFNPVMKGLQLCRHT